MAFPDKSTTEIKNIALGSFQNIAITFMELASLDKISDKSLNSMIDWGDSLNLISQVYARKRGCLFLSGHFGNWELIAYSVRKQTQLPITVIVKPQANYIADKFLNTIRTSGGNKILSMYNAARTLIGIVKNGEIVALLADQSATPDKDLYVKFFNKDAATYKVVAELALRYNIPIIMGFAIRQPNGRYKAELAEIDFSDLVEQATVDSKHKLENIKILTQRHVFSLENVIRQYPAQWA